MNLMDGLLTRWGTELTLVRAGEERTVRGLLQPVRSTSWQSMEDMATALGTVSQRQYRYIGPSDGDVRQGDVLRLGTERYELRRVETEYVGDRPLYQWGLAVKREEGTQWGA